MIGEVILGRIVVEVESGLVSTNHGRGKWLLSLGRKLESSVSRRSRGGQIRWIYREALTGGGE